MRQAALAAVAAISASFATLVSLGPVRIQLSKLGTDILSTWDRAFLEMSLPSLAVGLGTIFAGIYLRGSRPRLGWVLVIAAPILVLVAHILLQVAGR